MHKKRPFHKGASAKADKKDTSPKTITGSIFLTSKATGYVTAEGFKDDIEITPEHLNTALHKDEVRVTITGKFSSGRIRGVVSDIIRRHKERFVGTVERTKSGGYILVPDDRKFYTTIELPEKHRGAVREGDKALVKIIRWQNSKMLPLGAVETVIGRKGDNNTEMHSIALERGFSANFPPEVMAEAEALKRENPLMLETEIPKRRDFRKVLTFTIDPVDAKDFDDAISYLELPNGHVEIGVHIADASHYVRARTALDKEARERQLSVYLADRTIPMLPHILSNDLCSLNPHEDKLTFSAVFEMDKAGQVHKRWFGKTVINSAHRFSYEDAQKAILTPTEKYHHELVNLNEIAKKLQKKKFAAGAINFEKDEVKVEVDSTGKAVRIYKKKRFDAHKLVEEYMLLANREVAEFVFRGHEKMKLRGGLVYRIHDIPDREKVKALGIFVKALGYDLPIASTGKISPRDINALLQQVEGKAEEGLVKTAAIRTMAKAIYSTKNIGHFGLAFEFYSHFTSPIRRYPDTLVHRILAYHLDGRRIPDHEILEYELLCRKATEREIDASEAERESIKMKQVEFMQEQIGKSFDGTISGVTEWGIYVEEKLTGSEGMIKLRDLGDDYYTLDEKNYTVVGEKTKKKYRLGDAIRFKLLAADPEKKTLDFQLV
jgi:ribonuclease R